MEQRHHRDPDVAIVDLHTIQSVVAIVDQTAVVQEGSFWKPGCPGSVLDHGGIRGENLG